MKKSLLVAVVAVLMLGGVVQQAGEASKEGLRVRVLDPTQNAAKECHSIYRRANTP